MSGVENNLVEVPTEDMPITNETEMDSDTDTDADAATELVRPEDSRDESKETTPVMGEPILTQAKTEAERTDDGQSEQEHRG